MYNLRNTEQVIQSPLAPDFLKVTHGVSTNLKTLATLAYSKTPKNSVLYSE